MTDVRRSRARTGALADPVAVGQGPSTMAEVVGDSVGGMSEAWLATLRTELTHFSLRSRARGQQYAASGRVAAVHRDENAPKSRGPSVR